MFSLTLIITCRICGGVTPIGVDAHAYDAWRARSILIQDAFPHLTADERELVQTATCGACWEEMFGGMEEE